MLHLTLRGLWALGIVTGLGWGGPKENQQCLVWQLPQRRPLQFPQAMSVERHQLLGIGRPLSLGMRTHQNLVGHASGFFPQLLPWFFPHILNPMHYIPFFPHFCLPFNSRHPVSLIVQLALQFSQSTPIPDGVLSDVQQSQPWGSGEKHVFQANFASLELGIWVPGLILFFCHFLQWLEELSLFYVSFPKTFQQNKCSHPAPCFL